VQTLISFKLGARDASTASSVEDNPELRSLLVEIMTDAGYETEACWSFNDAKAKLLQGTFDLLITNILLPGGGHGTELAAIADSKGMKHLLVTGHPDQMQALERSRTWRSPS
jgi:DNA-binding NtrC family response regulator